jgi:hypothetical protein
VFRTGKSQRWFERLYDPSSQAERWAPFSPSFTGPREMWRKATRCRALFLTTAAQLNSMLLQPLLHWFEYCLEMVVPGDMADFNHLATDILDPDLKARMLSIIQSADIPIDDLRVAERTKPKSHESAHAESPPLLEFLHSKHTRSAAWLGANFESGGTLRLLGLLGPLLRTIDRGKVLVIDEFDTSLHPLLSRFLLQLIHYPVMAGKNAQLLLTSHNTTLMDLDMLRRDEIWFVELDQRQASHLQPLLRSSPRKSEIVMKAYLRGRYCAVPKIRPEFVSAIARSAQRTRPSIADPRKAARRMG